MFSVADSIQFYQTSKPVKLSLRVSHTSRRTAPENRFAAQIRYPTLPVPYPVIRQQNQPASPFIHN